MSATKANQESVGLPTLALGADPVFSEEEIQALIRRLQQQLQRAIEKYSETGFYVSFGNSPSQVVLLIPPKQAKMQCAIAACQTGRWVFLCHPLLEALKNLNLYSRVIDIARPVDEEGLKECVIKPRAGNDANIPSLEALKEKMSQRLDSLVESQTWPSTIIRFFLGKALSFSRMLEGIDRKIPQKLINSIANQS